MSAEEKIEIEIPNDTAYLDDLRNFIIKVAQRFSFNQEDIDDIEFAVDEAVANIIEHAYGGKRGYIFIKVTCSDADFTIELHDKGEKFDPTLGKLPDLDEHHEKKKTGGLGIYIMRKLMDTIKYHYIDGQGNYLVMVKHKKS